ncbi:hypothetical protein EEJ42_11885 [Streptomyces botrytidirepellens]|uniref:Uncharacterized protein n=1 Tax=Streptomyces botrytidirepellens TaxID=2486417 RepID=A0A3M8WJR7_9ACTN|nr:hypothetical protein EEJ42_11885 [Streptomyces botrytidirepellens]
MSLASPRSRMHASVRFMWFLASSALGHQGMRSSPAARAFLTWSAAFLPSGLAGVRSMQR